MNIVPNNEVLVRIAWLAFMLADIPRLIFRHVSFLQPFDASHRARRYSSTRIIIQSASQSVFYFVSLWLLYVVSGNIIFIIFAIIYLIPLIIRLAHHIKNKIAYVTTVMGHNLNNYVLKPLRLIFLIFITNYFQQPIWLIGFSIVFVKWILTLFYEKYFDVPTWYHLLLIVTSASLVLFIYPFDLGLLGTDTLRTFFTTIPAVYAAYIGLLGVFFGLLLSGGEKDMDLRKYFSGGIIANFSFTSALILLCLISIFVFGSESLSMKTENIFVQAGHLTIAEYKKYILFGVVLSLSWLLFFYTIMTVHIMLLATGKFIPAFWKKR